MNARIDAQAVPPAATIAAQTVGGGCSTAAPSNPPTAGVRPPRILLVDDEPINIKVVKKYLANAGYTACQSASNASEVLPLMIREEPDMVLLDIVMPGFSGLDLLAAIHADSQLTHIPVVML